MSKKQLIHKALKVFNALELLGIFIVIAMAFAFQFLFHELPCPLCILQRAGFIAMAFGLLLNLRFGFHPSHYALTILAAVFTAAVALRQIALHVVPGTVTYGNAFLGLHMYTWSFIIAAIVIVVTACFQSVDSQYKPNTQSSKHYQRLSTITFIALFIVAVLNAISTFAECGIKQCPDNPTHYQYVSNKNHALNTLNLN